MKSAGSAQPDVQSTQRLDLAARAAWLSYEKGRTQDQIAHELQVSRQVVQRLIALAHSSDLIEFRLKHALTDCIHLAEELRERFDLRSCEVAMNETSSTEDVATVGAAAARYLELVVSAKEEMIIGVGNGKTMREMSRRLRKISRPNCCCVSLMGNLTRDGRASNHDVVTWVADRLAAECYPRPMPVVTNTIPEREVLQAQPGFLSIQKMIGRSHLLIMGIGYWGPQASLLRDGFLTVAEAEQAMDAGAIGEFLGYAIDGDGQIIDAAYHARLTSYMPQKNPEKPVVVVASGTNRAPAIRAALTGRLANCLITDFNTAQLLLA
ncbi:MAG: sugar-binding transcriptional regulator [Alphaproteobacteria bacterium]|nr:sugar-binding transcriptional regulator [Alphaproteobacteria bacterium]MBU1551471.1 sugar-binding transcriptional regulator [Alphaproteobacteria bacterium]MBU2334693.1 sugar-binding transcriptional regulator [Alphaproteobacteria bacterium]MBU2386415.1 sugar-binding transcriptional regulator [Alphaproteobacteria bacterium]